MRRNREESICADGETVAETVHDRRTATVATPPQQEDGRPEISSATSIRALPLGFLLHRETLEHRTRRRPSWQPGTTEGRRNPRSVFGFGRCEDGPNLESSYT